MDTQAYLQKQVKSGESLKGHDFRAVAKRVICEKGTSLSVQASRTHYCTPRDNHGPYSAVEVGFPSRKPPKAWKEYCEDWEHPKDTVYAYVPIEMVATWIDLRGGVRKTN